MKILIVEDNPANMNLVSNLLQMSGYDVLQAEDAGKGICIAKKEVPALILMDIQLPGIDGLTAVKHLKSNDITRKIPIIAMTSFAMKGDEEKMIEAGCDAYIAKPYDYKKFLEKVKSMLADS